MYFIEKKEKKPRLKWNEYHDHLWKWLFFCQGCDSYSESRIITNNLKGLFHFIIQILGKHSPWAYLVRNLILIRMVVKSTFYDVGKLSQNRFFWPIFEKSIFDPRIGLNPIFYNGNIILKIVDFVLYRNLREPSIFEKKNLIDFSKKSILTIFNTKIDISAHYRPCKVPLKFW